jgi:hypothetical protein
MVLNEEQRMQARSRSAATTRHNSDVMVACRAMMPSEFCANKSCPFAKILLMSLAFNTTPVVRP